MNVYDGIFLQNMRLVVFLLWLLYFLQGIPYGFQTKFLPVFLRSYSLSLTLISLTRLLSLPWLLKLLWAPLIDRFGTKISWIKYNLVGMGFCYFTASFMSLSSVTFTVVVVACLNFMAATQDIAVDSLFVDYLTPDEIGLGNIAQVVGYKTGSLFGGGVLGWMSSSYPWQQLFLLLFVVYMTSAILVCSPFFINLTQPQVVQRNNFGETPEQSSKHVHSNNENVQENRTKVGKQLNCKETELKSSTVTKRRNISQDIIQPLNYSQQKSDLGKVVKSKFGFLKAYLNAYQDVLKSDGTKWTIVYVLIYKLGEQGVIAIFPMFLLDQGLSSSDTAIVTGVLFQFCSIFGSLLGGMLFSTSSWKGLYGTLSVLSTLRFSAACVLTWLVAAVNVMNIKWIAFVLLFACLLHLASGMITTVTFSLMIACSQKCPRILSATHYSTLATFEVLGKLCMVSISGMLVDMIGYVNFFIICNFLTLLPIFLLRMWNSFKEGKVKVKN